MNNEYIIEQIGQKDEDKKKLMENLDPWKITEQDHEIFKKIKEFIEES